MVETNTPAKDPTEATITLERLIDAPRERVFQAWVEPKFMRQWSAPRGFTISHGEGDLRPGGVWRCCMRSPDGVDLWLGGVYREIVPPERLVFTHAWDVADGKPGPETSVSVTLTDQNGKTALSFRQDGFESRESRDGHEAGWSTCLDQLTDLMAKP